MNRDVQPGQRLGSQATSTWLCSGGLIFILAAGEAEKQRDLVELSALLGEQTQSPSPTIPAHFSTLSQRVPDIFHKSLYVSTRTQCTVAGYVSGCKMRSPSNRNGNSWGFVGFGNCRQTLAAPGYQMLSWLPGERDRRSWLVVACW